MSICASFVAGGDSDTVKSVRDIFDFSIKEDFARTFVFSLCEIPNQTVQFGSSQLIPNYRIMPEAWKNFIGTWVGYFPKRMKPSTLQKELEAGYRKLTSWKRIGKNLMKCRPYKALSIWHYRNSAMPSIKVMKDNMEFLRSFEDDYYTEDETLIEEKLKHDYEKKQGVFDPAYAKKFAVN